MMKAAYWANLPVTTSSYPMARDVDIIIIYNLRTLNSTILRIYLYVLLKNNVVIKEKVNENTRKAAKTMWTIDYAKPYDSILWIHP